jgi:hypothetical protein
MKRIFLIQYNVPNPIPLDNRVKALGPWVKYFGNSWLVETTLTAEQIYSQLSVDFKDDSMFIIEVKKESYFGRMNTVMWDYLKSR